MFYNHFKNWIFWVHLNHTRIFTRPILWLFWWSHRWKIDKDRACGVENSGPVEGEWFEQRCEQTQTRSDKFFKPTNRTGPYFVAGLHLWIWGVRKLKLKGHCVRERNKVIFNQNRFFYEIFWYSKEGFLKVGPFKGI